MDAKTGHAILSDQIKKIDPSNTYDVVGVCENINDMTKDEVQVVG